MLGSADYLSHLKNRIKYLKEGLAKSNSTSLNADIKQFEEQDLKLQMTLYGDGSLAKREFETVPGFVDDMESMVYFTWAQSYGSTKTLQDKYLELKNSFALVYAKIKELKTLTEQIEAKAEGLKMPATYGRLPVYGN